MENSLGYIARIYPEDWSAAACVELDQSEKGTMVVCRVFAMKHPGHTRVLLPINFCRNDLVLAGLGGRVQAGRGSPT